MAWIVWLEGGGLGQERYIPSVRAQFRVGLSLLVFVALSTCIDKPQRK